MKKTFIFLGAAFFAAALAWGQSITVISANGGESWPLGSRQIISWSHVGCTGSVRINLVRPDNTGAGIIVRVPVSDLRYEWTVGETQAGTAPLGQYRIGLYVPNQDVEDQSNGLFAITDGTGPTAAIKVLSPNGGEKWGIGSLQTIRWEQSGLSGDAQIILYRDNGARFDRLATVPVAGGSYSWIVGETEVLKRTNSGYAPAGSYRIELKAGELSDRSDAAFAIQESNLPEICLLGWHYEKLVANSWEKVDEPMFGDEIRFVAQVGNSGQAPIAKPFHIELSVEGPEGFVAKKAEFDYPPLPLDGSWGAAPATMLQYKCTHEGGMSIQVKLDTRNEIIEADETNNSRLYRHRVLPPCDLVMVDVAWFAQVDLGDTQSVWGKVRNVGKGPSPQAQLDCICSGDKKRTSTIRPLQPGEEQRFEFHFEYWTTGSKRGQIVIDKDNRVHESNEEYNRVVFSYDVVTGTVFD